MLADFHVTDLGYVLIKQAKIWAMESNEYVYLFSAPTLDAETVRRCLDYAVEDGQTHITPHAEHRDSYIIAVFVADVIDPEAQKEIRHRKFDRSYRMGLDGWAALRTAGLELEKELIVTNRLGKDIAKSLKKLLRSEKA